MTWPAIILWLLIILSLISRGTLILYLFSVTVIFGGLTMAPPGLTGGLNLPAQTVCAAILVFKIFLRSDNLALAFRQSLDVRKLGLLAFFLVYVVVTAMLFPRLFRGGVMLYSLNAAASESALAPTSANFTQTMYLVISISITFAFAMAGRRAAFRQAYMRSILLAGAMLVASGAVDLGLNALHALALLQPFHNAAYASLDTVSIAGQYRVVGFMPEASVYGAACCTVLSFLVFAFQFFEARFKRIILPALIVLLALMILLSTSSTGYLGLIILAILVFGRWSLEVLLIPARSQRQKRKTAYISILLVLSLMVLAVVGPYLVAKYQNLLNSVLLDKATSSSFRERSHWTQAGLQAFFATNGFGVGVGSVRTSNWFINVLASTGVLGVGLLLAFYLKMVLPYRGRFTRPEARHFSNALKLSLVPTAAMIGVSGTTPDPGVWVMAIFGLLYGLRLQAVQDQVAGVSGLALSGPDRPVRVS